MPVGIVSYRRLSRFLLGLDRAVVLGARGRGARGVALALVLAGGNDVVVVVIGDGCLLLLAGWQDLIREAVDHQGGAARGSTIRGRRGQLRL